MVKRRCWWECCVLCTTVYFLSLCLSFCLPMLYPPEFLTSAPHVNRNRIKCIDAFISGPFLN
jgi:hypothetical protein